MFYTKVKVNFKRKERENVEKKKKPVQDWLPFALPLMYTKGEREERTINKWRIPELSGYPDDKNPMYHLELYIIICRGLT